VAGLVAFSGIPELSTVQLAAIQALSYGLLAYLWALGAQGPLLKAVGIQKFKPPTPGENEVMRLSSRGRISVQIARDLGLSPRRGPSTSTSKTSLKSSAPRIGRTRSPS